MGLSFGIDWLGDSLSADEIAEVELNIAEKGAAACYTTLHGMRHPDQVKGWSYNPDEGFAFSHIDLRRWPVILNPTNLKTVPAAGLGIAACRLHGRHPKAGEWLELARSSMREFAAVYGRDGCYHEGVSYWCPPRWTWLSLLRCSGARWASMTASSSTTPARSNMRSA